jgi:hypothetical protein
MRGFAGLLGIAAALAGFGAAAGVGWAYPTPTPVPRTTSVPALQALATQREVEERFKAGLAAEARGDWEAAVPEFQRVIA